MLDLMNAIGAMLATGCDTMRIPVWEAIRAALTSHRLVAVDTLKEWREACALTPTGAFPAIDKAFNSIGAVMAGGVDLPEGYPATFTPETLPERWQTFIGKLPRHNMIAAGWFDREYVLENAGDFDLHDDDECPEQEADHSECYSQDQLDSAREEGADDVRANALVFDSDRGVGAYAVESLGNNEAEGYHFADLESVSDYALENDDDVFPREDLAEAIGLFLDGGIDAVRAWDYTANKLYVSLFNAAPAKPVVASTAYTIDLFSLCAPVTTPRGGIVQAATPRPLVVGDRVRIARDKGTICGGFTLGCGMTIGMHATVKTISENSIIVQFDDPSIGTRGTWHIHPEQVMRID